MNTNIDFDAYIKNSLDAVAGIDNWEWNDSGVEIVLIDKNQNAEVKFQQILSFFDSWKVDQLKEANMQKLFDAYCFHTKSYEDIIVAALEMSELEWVKTVGKNGSKVYASLSKRCKEMTLPLLLGSLKYMGVGFGVRKAKILLDQLSDQENVWKLTTDDIMHLDGFSVETSQIVHDGLVEASKFVDRLVENDLIMINKEIKSCELGTVVAVFTGFRDASLQSQLESKGAKVSTSVSKKTTHVVCADPTSTSGKAGKARELGIPVVSIEDFKLQFNLQ